MKVRSKKQSRVNSYGDTSHCVKQEYLRTICYCRDRFTTPFPTTTTPAETTKITANTAAATNAEIATSRQLEDRKSNNGRK